MWCRFDSDFATIAWFEPDTVFEVIAQYEDDSIPGGYAYDIRHPDGTMLHQVDGYKLIEVDVPVGV